MRAQRILLIKLRQDKKRHLPPGLPANIRFAPIAVVPTRARMTQFGIAVVSRVFRR
jgi:hypothetical protein